MRNPKKDGGATSGLSRIMFSRYHGNRWGRTLRCLHAHGEGKVLSSPFSGEKMSWKGQRSQSEKDEETVVPTPSAGDGHFDAP